jgi:hypothetical protein
MKIKMNRELFIYAAAAGIKGWGLISIFILEKPDLDGNLIKRENKTSSNGTKLVFLVFFKKIFSTQCSTQWIIIFINFFGRL